MALNMKSLVAVTFLAGALFGAPLPLLAQDAAPAAPEAAPAETPAPAPVVFASPALVTDIGQGNNAKLIEASLKRLGGVEFTTEPLAGVEKLEGVKTLVLGVGASTKGLGGAGLNADQEMERTKALVEAAKQAKIPIVGIHIGGEPRRGELSDRFNEAVLKASDVFIAWEGGNADGFFTRLAEENKKRLILVESKPAVVAEIVKLFNPEGEAKAEEATGPTTRPVAR